MQKQIVEKVNKAFPKIKIVGEEALDERMILETANEVEEQEKGFLVPFKDILENEEPLIEGDLSIFIDPLDCTRGFVCNDKWDCTVLIGVTYKNQPVLGIIGQPYQREETLNIPLYEPRILVGGSLFPCKYAF